ncbi:uncharacterized protein LOC133200334 [Saccostrea echinata]|uniref:uncharacterized protein LOC133200334 n=1 Tax=Saccostrea echinata TaxID=191078 RepID=UPI002A801F1B|nr:uncharacterized protein LOC133200334 [Saccostrea echinata]
MAYDLNGNTDEVSKLTDDEVCVLFCFLCFDSGPPDFSNTELLGLLKEIRRIVCHKYNPVTSEEAQQTLDRLKSRDYLWEDKDKITKDTKDETMYRIASIKYHIPFYYSSYDTASVYLRSERYNSKPGEKCFCGGPNSHYGLSTGNSDDILLAGYSDYSLIRRLQMNILTHVTMEDTTIYDDIHQILNVSVNILKKGEDKREEFLMDLRRGGEAVHYRGRSQDSVDHVTWLRRYLRPDIVRSCIGLHPHNDIYIIDNKAYRKRAKYHTYSSEVRCLLYCLLLTEKYQLNLNEQSHRITRDEIRKRYFTDITDDGLVDLPDGITETHNGVMTFKSDDIRHDVMYAFVTECLVEGSDLDFFLTTASRDVISEYCRSWWYKRSEGERCLYIPGRPEKMYDPFVDKLQLDIITHCTMSDGSIHDRTIKRLGVPREILKWDQEARERYVEYAKRGTQTVHHARGMIVGCAGAGKTTLLKRLLGCSEEEIKEVKSTEGLEVHEEIFELCDETNSLKARRKYEDQKNLENNAKNLDAKTLSFFDFGGQCAYYACHQIYLTRRAFYVVVLDASKCLDQKVDKSVCDQDGSVFSGWTYGDYFVFWLKSIHTYCGSDNENDPKPVVLIVATHWEEGSRQFKDKDELMESLRNQLPKRSNLSQYIRKDRFHCTQLSLPLYDLERSFYDIACHQRWKESIPKEWFFFQIEINQKKHSKRIIDISKITTKVAETTADYQKSSNESSKEKLDMLRYYHDAGKVLYFNEAGLSERLIIDIQWFIDAFKHIITDKLHFEGIPGNEEDWDEYYVSGNLRNKLLEKIWKRKDEELLERLKRENEKYKILLGAFKHEERYLEYHQESLLNFMQRLGLLVVGKESHYVPCMNRKEMESVVPDLIRRSESKSSVLIYQFTFLPFFFFFRLVVACMQEKNWKVLKTHDTPCLYKNATLFSFAGYTVVLSVTKESIQLQIFHPKPGCILERDKTQLIQERVENILKDFAGKFHRKLLFARGFRCRLDDTQLLAMDIKGHFLSEEDIPKDDQEMICPLHSIIDQHFINTKELTRYWKM